MTREEAIEILHFQTFVVDFQTGKALEMAISALRKQETVTDSHQLNEPLTLDELRKMDGEPVWVKHYNGEEWVVVHWNIYARITTAYNAELRYDEYGERWLAYRQKPEEERHENEEIN